MENNFLIILLLNVFFIHEHMAQRYEGDSCRTKEGATGVCRVDTQCPSVLQRYREQRIRPTICAFSGRSTLVCCPPETPTTTTTTDAPPIRNEPPKERISEKMCKDYSLCFVGIVGGVSAKAGEFPHMAAIGWPLANGSGYSWNCGGTLISNKFVVTAAHCTYLPISNVISSEAPTMIRLGDLNLNSDSDNLVPVDVPIRSIQVHPLYQPPSRYHDIALMEMNDSVRFSRFIKPACLWILPQLTQITVTATGWGASQYMGAPADDLQKVNLTVFNSNSCIKPFPPNRRLPLSVIEQQLCAGDLTNNKDTCQGDSGGPLQVPHQDYSCGQYVVGITSIGINCGKNLPGLYTRVSSYVDWIENIVWPGQ